MVSFADTVDVVVVDESKEPSQGKIGRVSFSKETKGSVEDGLIPTIETVNGKEIITYRLGMLKELCVYETSLRVAHEFGPNIDIEFKRTSNYTIIDITPMINNKNKQLEGHIIKIQIHPQKALLMKDCIGIQFIESNKNKNKNEKMAKSNKNDLEKKEDKKLIVKHGITVRIDAKVLRKDQGTPLVKSGIHCIQGKCMIDTDVSD